MRNPWMKFYPSDWRADPLLRSCDPMSRYLWLEMIGLMHEAEPYGHLVLNGNAIDDETLAALAGMPLKAVRSALRELSRKGVFSLTDDGIIYSRRMVRDEMRATSRRLNGAKGGNPTLKNQGVSESSVNQEDNRQVKPQKPEARSQNKPPKSPEGFESDFAEFWSSYPKREGGNPRKPALKAYASKRKAGATHDAIMKALQAFIAAQKSMGKIGTVYIPMAATWLNREEWEQPEEKPAKPTAAETRIEVWRGATRMYVNQGIWHLADRSPPPDHHGTLVPAEILREFNITPTIRKIA